MAEKNHKNLVTIAGLVLIGITVVLGLYYAFAPVPGPVVQGSTLTILGADCENCYDTGLITQLLEQQGIVVDETKQMSIADSQKYVDQYGLEKLPAALLEGVAGDVQGFEAHDEVLVLSDAPPPYYDTNAKEVKGHVDVTIITSDDCDGCLDVTALVNQLDEIGVSFSSKETVTSSSEKGQTLIQKYSITRVPTLLFSEDITLYEMIAQNWGEVGTAEEDGTQILREVSPPYKDLETGNVEGFVKLTYLVDETCESCYDHELHKGILERNFAMQFSEELVVDVNSAEGGALVEKYNVTLVPTAVLSPDAKKYLGFENAWEQVGSKESDGTYVFRAVDAIPDANYTELMS